MLLLDVIQHQQFIGKGKQSIFKYIKESEEVRRCCQIFKDENASRRQIGEAGVSVFIEWYGGKVGDTLGKLRYSHFTKMASTSTKLVPKKLPPSEQSCSTSQLASLLTGLLLSLL